MPKRVALPSPARPALVLFTAPERDLIRREFHPRFGQDPLVADGIMLRTWRGGPKAGEPKLPPPVRTLLARGLVELRTDGRWPTAQFTHTGLTALRELAHDRRALDPARYGHVRRELGLDVVTEETATEPGKGVASEADQGRDG